MSVNIPRSNIDPFARYRRARIIIRAGKANTTVWTNSAQISHQLYRDPAELVKYLQRKLGTNTRLANGEIVIKGSFTVQQLEDYLETYIQEFVLCPQCGNPETALIDDSRVCKACGWSK